MIRIAVSKGRVAEQTLIKLNGLGYDFQPEDDRLLSVIDTTGNLELVFLKAQDIPFYVANAIADLGIVGNDILNEYPNTWIELMALDIGFCRMCLAGPRGRLPEQYKWLTLATKYPNAAKAFLKTRQLAGEIVPLQGSVELAPLLGISDLIVDLVETGSTLRAHDLVIHEELFTVSSRLIANPTSYQNLLYEIQPLLTQLGRSQDPQ